MKRQFLTLILGVGLTGAFVASAALPAEAGVGVPDMKVSKHKSGPFKGNGLYNETGADQTVKKQAHPGDVKNFYFKAENDGAGAEELEFDATFNNFDALKYKYFRGDTDITDTVFGIATHGIELDAGEQKSFRVRIKVRSTASALVYSELAGLGDVSDTDVDIAGYKVKVV